MVLSQCCLLWFQSHPASTCMCVFNHWFSWTGFVFPARACAQWTSAFPIPSSRGLIRQGLRGLLSEQIILWFGMKWVRWSALFSCFVELHSGNIWSLKSKFSGFSMSPNNSAVWGFIVCFFICFFFAQPKSWAHCHFQEVLSLQPTKAGSNQHIQSVKNKLTPSWGNFLPG